MSGHAELDRAVATSRWTADHLRVPSAALPRAPVIGEADLRPVLPGHDVWDMWPLCRADGTTAELEGGSTLWFALSAPVRPDPIERHELARIRLLLQRGESWRDCGPALPADMSPGSREWSGSALLAEDGRTVTLFFTAAGRRGEARPSFEQRLFQLRGTLRAGPGIEWHGPPSESVASDDETYVRADQLTGSPGTIKAFRDPAYFRDPADGSSCLVFAASLKASVHAANGVVGLARAADATLGRWSLLPPLLSADGLNNELERPHLLRRDGRYYLFWSTQTHTFAADGPKGPNGLYGAVADRLLGPYRPLNGSGLVLGNPAAEPTQAYSWWVMADGTVTSFVDYWGMGGRLLAEHPQLARSRFGGVPAPFLRLHIEGDRAFLAEPRPA